MTKFDPRRIWITGGSAGIGRATALAYLRRGAAVAVSARPSPRLDALAADAQALPGRLLTVPLDVADRAATSAAVETIEAELGPLDLALLNAGTHAETRGVDFSLETVDQILRVNLDGVLNGLGAVLPRMVARGAGMAALVGSVAGYRGLPYAGAYCASKAATIALAESLALELEPRGVRIRIVNPGFVRTPLTDRNKFPMPFLMEPDAAAERIVAGLASGRFETTFPRRFVWRLKALRLLPFPLYAFLLRRATKVGR